MAPETGLDTIEKTLHKTNEWLKEIESELGWEDRHDIFQALRGVLHTLRDRLPMQEAVDLGDQLPTLIRGLYYENWRPADVPIKDRRLENFLDRLHPYLPSEANLNTERVARAVFKVIKGHVSEGETRHILANMPEALKHLWD